MFLRIQLLHCPKSGQLTNQSLSPAAKDGLQSKNKSRLAAGVAPVQVTSLSVFGNYKKHLRHCYTLFGAIRGSRAANHDLCKTGAAERTVLPKRVNVPLLPKETTPSGTEGKPDFPLKVRPNSFFVCFPVTRFSKKEFALGRNSGKG